jgi:hypothetical protein
LIAVRIKSEAALVPAEAMIIKNLGELKPVQQRAIIINYNTRNVSSLALLSALRYAKAPVLLVDCQSTDGSFDHFRAKKERHEFDLFSAPLRKHGETLDWLFSELHDDKILLIDSDVEILAGDIISFLNQHIDEPRVFGSGFLHGPGLLKDEFSKKHGLYDALYYERPFIPLALFKVAHVKEALQAGVSFCDALVDNEYARMPANLGRVARKLFRMLRLTPPVFFRTRYFTCYPNKVFYDTGAKLYEYLRYHRFLFFANIPEPCHSKYITHFWGVTRNMIQSSDTHIGEIRGESLDAVVTARLRSEYNETA